MGPSTMVMGPGENFWLGLGQFFVARVSHLWFGFGKFPLKMLNLSIFSLCVKKNLFGSGQKVPGSTVSRPLFYCGSKVSSGRGPSLLHHAWNLSFWFWYNSLIKRWDKIKKGLKWDLNNNLVFLCVTSSKSMSWRRFFLTGNLFLYFCGNPESRVTWRYVWIGTHDPPIPNQLRWQWATATLENVFSCKGS